MDTTERKRHTDREGTTGRLPTLEASIIRFDGSGHCEYNKNC